MPPRSGKALPEIDLAALETAARAARRFAYAPYSRFRVGAAVLGASGRIFTGCNVENSSYGLALCAERNAVGQAVAAGDRRLLAVAVAVSGRPCPPCGMCRQVLFEFGSPDLAIALVGSKARAVHTLRELLPHAFGRDFL